jgi:SAM-dependent methyltransferase
MSHDAVNDAQRVNWNEQAGPKWIRYEALLEAELAPIAALLLTRAAPAAGQAVLEIGCGTGTMLSGLAETVGEQGRVVGIDISATMLGLARTRAPASVQLIEGDAQTAPLGGPYQLMLSRFGVMFFADPVAAFAHLRGALAEGGRLCFVCWSRLEDNPHWATALAAAVRHLGAPSPSDPLAPGPLAFADPDRVGAVLDTAGFSRVSIHTLHVKLAAAGSEEAAELAVRMGPAGALIREREASAETIEAIRDEIARDWTPQQASIHLVEARG